LDAPPGTIRSGDSSRQTGYQDQQPSRTLPRFIGCQEMKNITKTTKTILTFENEDAERAFWAAHDTTDYIRPSQIKKARFPRLKKTTFKTNKQSYDATP